MKQTAIRHLWPLLALALLVWGAPAAAQTGAAGLRVEPESLNLAAGETQTVTIVIQDAAEVYGIDARAAFDPALIEVVDANPARDGVQMTPGAFPQPDFVALNLADNAAGALRYAVTQVNPTPPATGGGVVFSFQVRGRANGVSPLRLVVVEMANRSGELLSVTTDDGAITVTGGQPPAATGVAVTIPAEGALPAATANATTTAPAPTATAATTIAAEIATATTAAPAATIATTTTAEAPTGPAGGLAAPQPTITAAAGSVDLAATTAAPPGEADAAATPAPAVLAEMTANPAAATTTAVAGDPASGASAPPAVVGAGTDATGPEAAPPAGASPGGALVIGGVVVVLVVAAVAVLAWRGRR